MVVGEGMFLGVRIEKAMIGTINGGGPEIQFKTFNGGIYIHNGAK
jgi:DUF4097 and DUF4098 domain-containing protein YvlB